MFPTYFFFFSNVHDFFPLLQKVELDPNDPRGAVRKIMMDSFYKLSAGISVKKATTDTLLSFVFFR